MYIQNLLKPFKLFYNLIIFSQAHGPFCVAPTNTDTRVFVSFREIELKFKILFLVLIKYCRIGDNL